MMMIIIIIIIIISVLAFYTLLGSTNQLTAGVYYIKYSLNPERMIDQKQTITEESSLLRGYVMLIGKYLLKCRGNIMSPCSKLSR
jgi:hypothetical protein